MRFITAKETARSIGVGVQTLLRYMNEGMFPECVRIGDGKHARIMWDYDEVQDWMQAKKDARSHSPETDPRLEEGRKRLHARLAGINFEGLDL